MQKPIDDEQLIALLRFRRENGRTWKSELRAAWYNASLTGTLHALRNSHGPTWLVNFRFADHSEPARYVTLPDSGVAWLPDLYADCGV